MLDIDLSQPFDSLHASTPSQHDSIHLPHSLSSGTEVAFQHPHICMRCGMISCHCSISTTSSLSRSASCEQLPPTSTPRIHCSRTSTPTKWHRPTADINAHGALEKMQKKLESHRSEGRLDRAPSGHLPTPLSCFPSEPAGNYSFLLDTPGSEVPDVDSTQQFDVCDNAVRSASCWASSAANKSTAKTWKSPLPVGYTSGTKRKWDGPSDSVKRICTPRRVQCDQQHSTIYQPNTPSSLGRPTTPTRHLQSPQHHTSSNYAGNPISKSSRSQEVSPAEQLQTPCSMVSNNLSYEVTPPHELRCDQLDSFRPGVAKVDLHNNLQTFVPSYGAGGIVAPPTRGCNVIKSKKSCESLHQLKDTNQSSLLLEGNSPALERSPCSAGKRSSKEIYVESLVETTALVIQSIWSDRYTQKTSKLCSLRTFIQEVLRRSRTTYSTLQVALFYLFRVRLSVQQWFEARLKHRQGGCACNGNNQCAGTDRSQVAGVGAGKPVTSWSDHLASQARNCPFGDNDPILCGRRMFLASVIVASKYLQDKNYRNKAWAKISGLPVEEINETERRFLELIDYKLFVSREGFEKWYALLNGWVHKVVSAKVGKAPPPMGALLEG